MSKRSRLSFLGEVSLYFAFCALPVLIWRSSGTTADKIMFGLIYYLAMLVLGLAGFEVWKLVKRPRAKGEGNKFPGSD